MKVVKEGDNQEKTYKKTCKNCKSKLEYTAKDKQQDRDSIYVMCPTCESYITVDYVL